MSKSPKKPLSERRLAANRANAANSTGPRTPEGKSASSQNAVKHGFCASSFTVVRLEGFDEIANLKADAVSFYQPVNAQELIAVERIALAQQQLFRASRLEAGLFTDAINESLDSLNKPIKPMDESLVGTGDIDICKSQNRNYCLAEGFRRMAKESNIWSLFLRYQAQADRLYRRALEDFERLKALRDQLPNEPVILTQPQQPEELATLDELNPIIEIRRRWDAAPPLARLSRDSHAAAGPKSAPPAGPDPVTGAK